MDYREIIELIKAKEKAGIDNLYNDYATKLCEYAIRQWRFSEDDAWEMVYKTLHTLLLKLPTYEIESTLHFSNIIFKIFKNNLRQYYRDRLSKDSNIEFVSVERWGNEAELRFPVEQSVFTDYYQNEAMENPLFTALKNGLEKLNPDEKELLLLKTQNYSYDEIAAMLGIENNQLKVKHHRAKKKLIELIEKQQTGVHEHAK